MNLGSTNSGAYPATIYTTCSVSAIVVGVTTNSMSLQVSVATPYVYVHVGLAAVLSRFTVNVSLVNVPPPAKVDIILNVIAILSQYP